MNTEPVKALDHGVVWWPRVMDQLDVDGELRRLWARQEDGTLHAIMRLHPGNERHYWWTWDELAVAFGMEGEVRRLWVEDDEDYVHIVTQWTGLFADKPKHFRLYSPGGTTECRVVVLDPSAPLDGIFIRVGAK